VQEIVGELGRVVRQMAAVADRCLTVLIELLTMVAFATSLPPTVPLPAATRRRLFIKCNSSCSSSSSKPEHRTLIAGRPAGTVPCRAVPCRAGLGAGARRGGRCVCISLAWCARNCSPRLSRCRSQALTLSLARCLRQVSSALVAAVETESTTGHCGRSA